jgi:guanylate kinase
MTVSRPPDLPPIPPGPPLLVVISGASGAGKDTLRDLLMAWGLPCHFAVTATTRSRREGEVEGRDYYFLTDAEFDRLEREGGLVERAIVYGQKKGVPREEVSTPLAEGRDVLVRVDVQGAAALKRLVPGALLIFVAAPSAAEAASRLGARETESEAEMASRLAAAAAEAEAAAAFDHVIVNETGRPEEAARRVWELIAAWKAGRPAP